MELTILPDDFANQGKPKKDGPGKISIVPYESSTPVLKEKSMLRQNMISLLMEGEKMIYVNGDEIHTSPDSVLLLGSGNYLFTERLSGKRNVKSIMLFFDDQVMPDIDGDTDDIYPICHASFPKDEYVWQYISSLKTLLSTPMVLTEAMKLAKLKELLVYISINHPDVYKAFRKKTAIKPEALIIKEAVEANIANNLSLDELAFLCNMSLATFKRKFENVYHSSPAKWLQTQRLEIAARKLRQTGLNPAELYLQAGYENHSSFSKAFKMHFGVSPKDYALKKK